MIRIGEIMKKVETIASWIKVLDCLDSKSSWRMKKEEKKLGQKRWWRRRRRESSIDSG